MRDPYVYKDSDVLINKENIKDADQLDEFENRMTTLALIDLFKGSIRIKSSRDVFKLHKRLFEYVYDWAGKPRTVDIYKEEPIINGKSVEYERHHNIIKALDDLDRQYFNQEWKSFAKEDFIHVFTRMISDIWRIHPFREGNTRAVSTFALMFLRQYGYGLNAQLISQHAKYFRNALVMASLGQYSEYQYVQNIMIDAVSSRSEKPQEDKYRKIKDYHVDHYEHTYHKAK